MIRLLVAEDEAGIRNSLEQLLRLEGYDVTTCADGQQALKLAELRRPDVVITDVHMPVMDGFDLLSAIRFRPDLSTCVVIMLTAAEDRANVRQGMTLGADDYITKPFTRDELLTAIRTQLDKRQALQGGLKK
ncbi:MAG TPA: response regulator [Burkholderiaceae bacterium]|nr:response regulator [Burkholderiaceae bacterium]